MMQTSDVVNAGAVGSQRRGAGLRTPSAGPGTRATRSIIALALALLSGARSSTADAACNVIPPAVRTFRGTNGQIDRPYFSPGDRVSIGLDRACHPDGLDLGAGSRDHVVTVVFKPARGEASVVLLTDSCRPNAPEVVACAEALGGVVPVCRRGNLEIDHESVPNQIRFDFPDTDDQLCADSDALGLTGAVAIAVTPAGQPPACGLVRHDCTGEAGTIACIDRLFAADAECGVEPHSTFDALVALPPPNPYVDMCTTQGGVCTGRQDHLAFAIDGQGNALIPMDWRGVLVDAEFPAPRLLRAESLVQAFLGSGAGFRLAPGANPFASFSPEGVKLPPVFEPQVGTEDGETVAAVFGTADAPRTILRVARFPRGVGDPTAAEAAFDFSGRALESHGPVVVGLASCVADPDAFLHCPAARGTWQAAAECPISVEATDAISPSGIAQSEQLNAMVVQEGIVGKDLDGDFLPMSEVVALTDRRTGEELPIGWAPPSAAPARARRILRAGEPPFRLPALDVKHDVVAFLEPEAWHLVQSSPMEGNGDADGDDTMLRVYRRSWLGSGGDGRLASAVPRGIAAIGSPRINGRSLVIDAAGRDAPVVVFRRAEWDSSGEGPAPRYIGEQRFSFFSEDSLLAGSGPVLASSADGRVVAYESNRTTGDLLSGEGNAMIDVMVVDLDSGLTASRLLGPGGELLDASARVLGLSADGQRIYVTSAATSFAPRDVGGSGVFVSELVSGEAQWLMRDPRGATPDPAGPQVGFSSTEGGTTAAFIVRDFTETAPVVSHLEFWDLERREQIPWRGAGSSLDRGPQLVTRVSSSRDGRFIAYAVAMGGNPGTYVYDLQSRSELGPLEKLLRSEPLLLPASSTSDGWAGRLLVAGKSPFLLDAPTARAQRIRGAGGDPAAEAILGTTDDGHRMVGQLTSPTSYPPGVRGGIRDLRSGETRFLSRTNPGTVGALPRNRGVVVRGALRTTADGGFVSDLFLEPTANRADDLTGDGDGDDIVLSTLQVDSATPSDLCPSGSATLHEGSGLLAFLRPEWAGDTSVARLPLCPRGVSVEGGVDLNGDGDAIDEVVHLWRPDGGAVENLGASASRLAISGEVVAAVEPPPGPFAPVYRGERPVVGSLRALLLPSRGANIDDRSWVTISRHVGQFTVWRFWVVYVEADSGACADDDPDCTVPSGHLMAREIGGAGRGVDISPDVTEFVIGDTGLIAFRRSEASAQVRLNPDGDTTDFVLHTFRLDDWAEGVGAGARNSGQSAVPCRLPTCDPERPYEVLDHTVRILTMERDQDADLNGDGRRDDLVIQIVSHPREAEAAGAKPAAGVVATTAAGRCRAGGCACQSHDECPTSGDECVSDGGASVSSFPNPLAPESGSGASRGILGMGVCGQDLPIACTRRNGCPGADQRCDLSRRRCIAISNPCVSSADCSAAKPSYGGVAISCRRDMKPLLAFDDRDRDEIPDLIDNCPDTANPDQGDEDGDAIGDACDGSTDREALCEADRTIVDGRLELRGRSNAVAHGTAPAPGRSRIDLAGELPVPGDVADVASWAHELVGRGVEVALVGGVDGARRVLLEFTRRTAPIPGFGTAVCDGSAGRRDGWRASNEGRRLRYTNRSGHYPGARCATVSGGRRLSLSLDLPSDARGSIRFRLRVPHADVSTAGAVPLEARIRLGARGGAGATFLCGSRRFAATECEAPSAARGIVTCR